MGKKGRKGADPNGWLATYGDMVTLVLCFFVLLLGDPNASSSKIQLVLANFGGLGPLTGGMTLSAGQLAQVGASIENLPSDNNETSLEQSLDKTISAIQQEMTNVVDVYYSPERGIVISLTSDSFFRPGSAEVDLNRTRDVLDNLAHLFNSAELMGRNYRIEGHTDAVESSGEYKSGWELSAARAANVLHYLVDFGAPEARFQLVAYANTRPLETFVEDTPEALAANRRVDLVILTKGTL